MGDRFLPIVRDDLGRWCCAECGQPIERVRDLDHCCRGDCDDELPPSAF